MFVWSLIFQCCSTEVVMLADFLVHVLVLFCRLGLCNFSQQKIYPSRGKKYVRIDGKVRIDSVVLPRVMLNMVGII